MILSALRKKQPRSDSVAAKSSSPVFLIVEDDEDQLAMLVQLVRTELISMRDSDSVSGEAADALAKLKILKISDYATLEKATKTYANAIHVILDGNIPDSKGEPAHDQFVKHNHRITGQHRSVDLIAKVWPQASITMVSSRDRFQKLVMQHYGGDQNLDLKFISKREPQRIQRSIGRALQAFLQHSSSLNS